MRLSYKLLLISPVFLLIVLGLTGYYTGLFGSHLTLKKISYDNLPAWQTDDQSKALFAFKLSCLDILKKNPNALFSVLPKATQVKTWQTICLAAFALKSPSPSAARQFFETWFIPYQVKNNGSRKGLFTGYYLPLLHAKLKKDKEYAAPIYGLPTDLVKINHFTGQIKNNIVTPFPDRAAILHGAIDKTAPVIAWSNSVIDVFFAQIQGSAILELPNHQKIMIGYAADNGYPYTPIGRVLIQNHALTAKEVSMQTIRDWLIAHPTEMNSILNHDASYVFFKILKTTHPLGIEQVPLTPLRTLAIDTHYIPLGAPIWLETTIPNMHDKSQTDHFQHLLIAQDTGGAIKGVIRGDIYFGAGDDATFFAGHMNQIGRYWLLLPK